MTSPRPEDYVPKIARNELFYFVARASTLLATLIGLPIAGWMLSRAVTQADAISLAQTQQNIEIRLLTQKLDSDQSNNVRTLSDHELRLRTLERTK